MYMLIVDVKLKVRIGDEESEDFATNVGICQGDCLSALIFIFYLAKAMEGIPKHTTAEDHKDKMQWSALDWMIPKETLNIEIDPQYADDINFVRSEKAKLNQLKWEVPPLLKSKHLTINKDKTEEYTIGLEGEERWKQCKILGSLLDTEKDINKRKGLGIDAYKTMEYIFKSKYISTELKIKTYKAYVEPIFLYNCELWNLTKT